MNSYTINDVKIHNTKNDAWVIINENIYDITDFLQIHPGGNIISQFLGQDITEYFYELHQSSILTDIAEDYKIGTLL